MVSKFWRQKVLILTPTNIQSVLSGERIRVVENIQIGKFKEDEEKLEEIFNILENSDLLVTFDVGKNDLTSLDSSTLAKVFCRIRNVILTKAKLSSQQIYDIHEKIANTERKDLKLRMFSVSNGPGDEVTETLLTSLITKLEEVSLENQFLGISARSSFLRNIANLHFVSLRKVSLNNTNLHFIDPEVMEKFACKLESLRLRNCNLTVEQIDGIFIKVAEGSSKLRTLDVFGNDLRGTDLECAVDAVLQLEEFSGQGVYTLGNPYGIDLAYMLCFMMEFTENIKLKNLEIDVIPNANFYLMARVESLTLNGCVISNPNLGELFFGVAGDEKLKKLTLKNCQNMNSVPTYQIELAMKDNLDDFVLEFTGLTREQCHAILSNGRHLKYLHIEGTDLSHFEPPCLVNLFNSELKPFSLEKIVIKNCNLFAHHVNGILQKIFAAESGARKSALKEITLEYHGDSLDEELLKKARRFVAVRLLKKENPWELKEEGNAAFKAGNFLLALAKYKQAIKFAENREEEATALKNRAAVHLKLKNYKAVVADTSRALDILPSDVKALYRRCRAYESLGDIKLALKDARKAKSINPRDRDIAETFNRVFNIHQEEN